MSKLVTLESGRTKFGLHVTTGEVALVQADEGARLAIAGRNLTIRVPPGARLVLEAGATVIGTGGTGVVTHPLDADGRFQRDRHIAVGVGGVRITAMGRVIVHDHTAASAGEVLEEHLQDLIATSCAYGTCHRRSTARLAAICQLVGFGDGEAVRKALYCLLARDQIRPRAYPLDAKAAATWHVPTCTRGLQDPVQAAVSVFLQSSCQWGECAASWQVVQALTETIIGRFTPAQVMEALVALRQAGQAVCLPAPGWGTGFRWHVTTCPALAPTTTRPSPPPEKWTRHLLKMPWLF